MAENKNETIKKAQSVLGTLTGDEEVQRLAYLQDKWQRDYDNYIIISKEEGAKQSSINTAKKLLSMNMPIEQIIEVTELTKEDIEILSKNV